MKSKNVPRVFIDSNVLIDGLFSAWSDSRAILVLARAEVFRLVLSPYVEMEVERALLLRFAKNEAQGSNLIDDYALAIKLLKPERTQRITKEEFDAHKHFIRHINDVPVLVTAIKSSPDWLVTANVEHFDKEVSKKTNLRIATPKEFLRKCGKF